MARRRLQLQRLWPLPRLRQQLLSYRQLQKQPLLKLQQQKPQQQPLLQPHTAVKGSKDAKGTPAAAAHKAKEASTAADKAGKGGKKAAADKAATGNGQPIATARQHQLHPLQSA